MRMRMQAAALSMFLIAAMTANGVLPQLSQTISLQTTANELGDINEDGTLDLSDVRLLQEYLIAQKKTAANADLNQDNQIDAVDLTLLKRRILYPASIPSGPDWTALKINEVCSTNKTSYRDSSDASPDWIELYNAGDTALELGGVGVSDGQNNRYKFTFPADAVIPADGYVIICCDDTDAVNSEYHAAFKISAAGETIYLTGADGSDIDVVTVPELETDITYGRYQNGSSDFALLLPSPGSSNDSASVQYRVEKPLFSVEGGFYDAAFGLNLTDANGNRILYTLDGSDPRTSHTAKTYNGEINIYDNTNNANVLAAITDISLRGYRAPNYQVDKGMVVRAVCQDANGNYSEVATNNYFIGKKAAYYNDMKVLAISTDSSNFFDNQTGIYMVGNQYYQWKNSGSFDPNLDPGSSENPTNYNSEGKEWERPCNIQVFEQGELKYTENVGVRISGNWSTAFAQKSMTLYARSEYGSNKMQYDFFEGLAVDVDGNKIDEYKKVTLRNGGNGYDNLRFRDDLNQWCAEGLQLDTQAKYDYIVFIDGEFWGYYSMQERLEDNYVESHYHIDADQVTTIKYGEDYDGLQSTYQDFVSFWNWAMQANLSDNANYQRVCDTIDIQGLMDLVVVESYIANWDCMINCNNWMIWRSDEVDPSNPYADGKWRFMLYDTEYSSGYDGKCSASYNYFEHMDRSKQLKSISSLFLALMNNAQFKSAFYDHYQKVVKEHFDTNRVLSKIDAYSTALSAAVTDTYRRFGVDTKFATHVKVVKNFFNRRHDYAMHHLNQFYGISDGWVDDPNLIDQFSWSIWMNDGLGSIDYADDGSIVVNVSKVGQYAQVSCGSVAMQAGKTYRMTFTIRTTQNVNTYVMFQEGGNDYTSYYWESRTFTPNTTQYTETVTMHSSDPDVKFLIGLDGVGTYYISDFSLVCVN